ncbi:hypothetical protein PGT21_008225 [Puccinia graminis f. sp. tritici]|uniref:Uncharacterized protein n=1 Tax=Puccinia graminis f. sp. tritici TaxID=56615 RepID=A0A5B0P544_PUCGR|nr:hypothetical protein PGT21_008225 [Puccinia graminis f. sp. tritici]KAA1099078.1 hypothetical protein PGTUg99_014857 [Puccinia graminis f. sp. tritici]
MLEVMEEGRDQELCELIGYLWRKTLEDSKPSPDFRGILELNYSCGAIPMSGGVGI